MKRLFVIGTSGPALKNEYRVDVTKTFEFRLMERIAIVAFWTALALMLVIAAVQFEHWVSKKLGQTETPQSTEVNRGALVSRSDSGTGPIQHTRKIGGRYVATQTRGE